MVEPRGRPGRRRARRFVATFLLVLCCLTLWALAMPLFSAADEGAHMVKAYAVVHGVPGRTDPETGVQQFEVPSVFRYGDSTGLPCFVFRPEQAADRLVIDENGPDHEVGSSAAGYPPLLLRHRRMADPRQLGSDVAVPDADRRRRRGGAARGSGLREPGVDAVTECDGRRSGGGDHPGAALLRSDGQSDRPHDRRRAGGVGRRHPPWRAASRSSVWAGRPRPSGATLPSRADAPRLLAVDRVDRRRAGGDHSLGSFACPTRVSRCGPGGRRRRLRVTPDHDLRGRRRLTRGIERRGEWQLLVGGR